MILDSNSVMSGGSLFTFYISSAPIDKNLNRWHGDHGSHNSLLMILRKVYSDYNLRNRPTIIWVKGEKEKDRGEMDREGGVKEGNFINSRNRLFK